MGDAEESGMIVRTCCATAGGVHAVLLPGKNMSSSVVATAKTLCCPTFLSLANSDRFMLNLLSPRNMWKLWSRWLKEASLDPAGCLAVSLIVLSDSAAFGATFQPPTWLHSSTLSRNKQNGPHLYADDLPPSQ